MNLVFSVYSGALFYEYIMLRGIFMLVYVGEIISFDLLGVLSSNCWKCFFIYLYLYFNCEWNLVFSVFGGGFIYEYVMLRGICVSLCEFV